MNELTAILVGKILIDKNVQVVDFSPELVECSLLKNYTESAIEKKIIALKGNLREAIQQILNRAGNLPTGQFERLLWKNENSLSAEVQQIGSLYEITIWQHAPGREASTLLNPEISRFILSAFPSLPVGIIIADTQTGAFKFANSFIADKFGYSYEEFLQLKPVNLHPPETAEHIKALFDGFTRGEARHLMDMPCVTKTGKTMFMDIHAILLHYQGISFVCGVFQENTQRHLEKERLLKANSLIESRRAERSENGYLSSIGNWYYEVKEDKMWWSPGMYEVMGQYEENYEPDYFNFLMLLHPADRPLLEESYRNHLKTGESFSITLRVLLQTNQTKYIQFLCSGLFDENHVAIRSYGLVADITSLKADELALKETNVNFRQIAENINEVFLITDKDNATIIFANKAFEQVLGLSREVLIAGTSSFKILVYHKDLPVYDRMEQQLNQTDNAEAELRIVGKDFSLKWLHFRVKGMRTKHGEPKGTIYIIGDITARKRAEKEAAKGLKVQEILTRISNRFIHLPFHRYNTAIDESFAEIGELLGPDRIYLFETNWEKQTASITHEWCSNGIEPQKENLQNHSLEELDMWMSQFRSGNSVIIRKVTELPLYSAERILLEEQGIQSLITVPLMDDTRCLGFVGFDYVGREKLSFAREERVLRMLAEQVVNFKLKTQTEQQLHEQNRFLTDLMNSSSAIIFEKDLAGRYVRVNKAWERTTRHLSAKVIGKTDYELFDEVTARQFVDNDARVISSGVPFFSEEKLHNQEVKKFYLSIKFPVYNHSGLIKGVAGIVTEITHIKKAQQELAKREANLVAIINSSVEAIWSVDAQYKIVYANDVLIGNFERAYGIKLCHGMSLAENIPPAKWKILKPKYDEVLLQGKPVSYLNYVERDGEMQVLDTHMKPITLFGEVHGVAVFSLNITQKLKAEKALKSSEQRFRSLFEDSSSPMLLVEPENCTVISSNKAANEYFTGNVSTSLVGKALTDYVEKGSFSPEEVCSLNPSESARWEVEIYKAEATHKRTAEFFATYLPLDDKPAVHIIINDTTEKHAYFSKIKAQNQIFSDIAQMQSHEFRAPLARAKGLFFLLKNNSTMPLLDDETKELFDYLEQSLNEMDDIVRSITERINLAAS